MRKISFNITVAKVKDIPSLVNLSMEMADYHRKIDQYYKPGKELRRKNKEWFLKILSKKSFKVLVVKEKNNAIGYGVASVEKAKCFVSYKKIGKINSVFIKEKYRGKGIGKKLLKTLLGWLKSQDVEDVELNVDSRNKAAINFYRKLGFFEFRKRMKIEF